MSNTFGPTPTNLLILAITGGLFMFFWQYVGINWIGAMGITIFTLVLTKIVSAAAVAIAIGALLKWLEATRGRPRR